MKSAILMGLTSNLLFAVSFIAYRLILGRHGVESLDWGVWVLSSLGLFAVWRPDTSAGTVAVAVYALASNWALAWIIVISVFKLSL